jgi:hypothetical protein
VGTFYPPIEHESGWNIVWLGVLQFLFYLFITVYCTPYFTLVAELGHTAKERLDLSTWCSVAFALGTILASAAPTIGGTYIAYRRDGLQLWAPPPRVASAVPLSDQRSRRVRSQPPSPTILSPPRALASPRSRRLVARSCSFPSSPSMRSASATRSPRTLAYTMRCDAACAIRTSDDVRDARSATTTRCNALRRAATRSDAPRHARKSSDV